MFNMAHFKNTYMNQSYHTAQHGSSAIGDKNGFFPFPLSFSDELMVCTKSGATQAPGFFRVHCETS